MSSPPEPLLPAVAPPVVAVMVVHQPGPWLTQSLRGLAMQDYPGLQALILVSGGEEDEGGGAIRDAIATELPSAVVRFTGSNAGFAASCNLVLNLVQGDSGFFCFLHDDVALEPGAVTQMVEELYRSNAGVVGPKLVHWEDPRMIQSVGISVDRFGVPLPIADDGEIDQEQHDAVQDVFFLSSACLLIRADLFRTIGGFNPSLTVHGADLDLCWRCHIAAARVVVVPGAVARHRESMARAAAEDPDRHRGDVEATRVATTASLTSTGQLAPVIAQMLVIGVARALVMTVTGRLRLALAEMRGLGALVSSSREIRARRAAVGRYRQVTGAEISALQLRGSAHVSALLRRRARRSRSGQPTEGSAREATPRSSLVMWVALVILSIIGSRSLISGAVSQVGQFVPAGGGPRELFASYASGWWGAAFGQVSAAPTGLLLAAASGIVSFGQMELARTLSIVLLPLVGWIGVWRFSSVLDSRASRIVGTLAYAAVPLPYASIAAGRWGALLLYACLPWIAHHGRVMVGHGVLSPAASGDGEPFIDAQPAHWRRAFAAAALLVAVCAAFEPGTLVVVGLLALVWAVVTLVHSGAPARALRWLGAGAGIVVCAIGLNLPWSATYVRAGWWEAITGAPVENGRDWGLVRIASFGVGDFSIGFLCVALYAVVVGAVVVVHGAKAAWALRGASLCGAALLLIVLDDAALLPVHLPEPAVMLVPVALGLAVSAASMGATLAADLRRGRFGWRQPFGALLGLVFVIGLLPAPLNALDGRWNQTSYSLPRLLAQLPDNITTGGYRTLFIGDPRVLPGAPMNLGWGISYSIVNGSSPDLAEMWELPPNRARDQAVSALYGIVRGRTPRAGRLLAPLAVRYVVVPVVDGAASTRDEMVAVPRGLVDSLARQLDLRRRYASPDLVIYENVAWVPVRSQLTAAGSVASARAGAESMITEDVSGATPFAVSGRADEDVAIDVSPGTVHFSAPFTTRWTLVGPEGPIVARPAFGLTNAYDVTTAGAARLEFDVSTMHTALVLIQMLAWALFLFALLDRRSTREGLPVYAGQWTGDGGEPVIDIGSRSPT